MHDLFFLFLCGIRRVCNDRAVGGTLPSLLTVSEDLHRQNNGNHAENHPTQQGQNGSHTLHSGVIIVILPLLCFLLFFLFIHLIHIGTQMHDIIPFSIVLMSLALLVGGSALNLRPLAVRNRPGPTLHIGIVAHHKVLVRIHQ